MNSKKILAIFNMYDAEGVADEYVFYLLDKIILHIDDLVIVCNGGIRSEYCTRFENYTKLIFMRENIGYDSGAYKDAILHFIGWEKIYKYDELILFNNTFFGPFYPLSEMFNKMGERNLDFWGITKQKPIYIDAWGDITEHLQAYFLYVNRKLLHSEVFRKFWTVQNGFIDNYKEAVFGFELRFTQYFAQCGYTWDSYINHNFYVDEKNVEKNFVQIYHLNYQLIQEKRCPILKRKVCSFLDIDNDMNEDMMLTLEYIKKYTTYNINFIWDDILRTQNMLEIQQALHLNFVIADHDNKNLLEKINNGIVFFLVNDLKDIDSKTLETLKKYSEYISIYIVCLCGENNSIDRIKIERIIPNCNIKYCGLYNDAYKHILTDLSKQYMFIGIIHYNNYKIYDNMLVSCSYLKRIFKVFLNNPQIDFLTFCRNNENKESILSENILSLTYDLWSRREFFLEMLEAEKTISTLKVLKKRKKCFGILQTSTYSSTYISTFEKKLMEKLKMIEYDRSIKHVIDFTIEMFLINIKKEKRNLSNIYIYGAGYLGCIVAKALEREKIEYMGFIVSQKTGQEIVDGGHKIYGLDEINFSVTDGIILAVKNLKSKNLIKELLRVKKVNFNNIFIVM